MEVETSRSVFYQKIIVWVLVFIAALFTILVIKKLYDKRDKTPRTAIERQLYDAQAVVDKDPRNPKAILKLAMVYAEAGRYNEAASQLNVAVKLSPRDPEIYYGVGVVDKKIGDTEGAIIALNRAVKLPGTTGDIYREAWYELGTTYYDQKKYKKATDALKEAEKQGPELIYIRIALAKAYEKEGSIKSLIMAKDEYENIFQYDSTYKDAIPAVKRIKAKLRKFNKVDKKTKNSKSKK